MRVFDAKRLHLILPVYVLWILVSVPVLVHQQHSRRTACVDASSTGTWGDDTSIHQRHSYSLTTFDPNGRLGQVERAVLAASKGPPIVACIVTTTTSTTGTDNHDDTQDDRIATRQQEQQQKQRRRRRRRRRRQHLILASPQSLPPPAPFRTDSGTNRFGRVTSEIVAGHSGLSPDGRVLLSAARRAAVRHEYTFGEEIPVALLLEELALLYQSYTMEPGARPFGTSLIIGYMPSSSTMGQRPMLFRIDPAGNVERLHDQYAVLNGDHLLRHTGMQSKLRQLVAQTGIGGGDSNEPSLPLSALETSMARIVRESIREYATKRGLTMGISPEEATTVDEINKKDKNNNDNGNNDDDDDDDDSLVETIVCASLSSSSSSNDKKDGRKHVFRTRRL